jgi:hypothetical protein
MKKEISRAEFIRYLGLVLLGLVGITGFLRNLHEIPFPGAEKQIASGFGKGLYGR